MTFPATFPRAADPAANPVAGSVTLGNVRVRFELDRERGAMVVSCVDPVTGAPARKMAAEQAAQVAEVMGRLRGLLVQRTA
jgi:uncharacterized FlaG/YvyC family protein